MPALDAFRLAVFQGSPGNIRIHLNAGARQVFLRRATSDIQCLDKVFICNEYVMPFKISPRVIVDAGANIGLATVYYANKYPDARILSIEPEPANFQMLKRNCAGLRNVTLMQAAIWPEKAALRFENSETEPWAFSVTDAGSDKAGSSVDAITMEEVLQHLGADQIDLLKVDIEGSELQLFSRGAERWIDRVEAIVIELHDRYRPGCAQAFYSVLATRNFIQEIRGENIFIHLRSGAG
jgi:FkbM family methyltransferase